MVLLPIAIITMAAEVAALQGVPPPANCNRACGGKPVPYPFGLDGDSTDCYLDYGFNLTCDASNTLLFSTDQIEVVDLIIPKGRMRILTDLSFAYYNDSSGQPYHYSPWEVELPGSFMLSHDENVFTAIGCDTEARFLIGRMRYGGCISGCKELAGLKDGECVGIGCCQSQIPLNVNQMIITIGNRSVGSETYLFNNGSYSFKSEKNNYTFLTSDVKNNISQSAFAHPVIFDWFIGNKTCEEANNSGGYACASCNSKCLNATNGPGYICNCSPGYDGNPYLENGCQDIDECQDLNKYPCYGICINMPGTYDCKCPEGFFSNDPKTESCIKTNNHLSSGVKAAIGVAATIGGLSFLSLLLLSCVLLHRKSNRRKDASYGGGTTLKTKVFPLKEMERATNKFSEVRIIGRGGHGTVYKRLLMDNTVVAIKRSNKKVDEEVEDEVHHFINEVSILSQMDHRNVVKMIGCCLETEVPLLVYEFISNGTLSDHLHIWKRTSSLSWDERLRVATEIASAVAYMHSAASRSIFHRDLKTVNVLLDERLTAKVSDFGTSKSVMTDQTHVTTGVQGTSGYLDPEYFQTGMLTEKSDVYSFGVILVELLTGQTPHPQPDSTFLWAFRQRRALALVEPQVIEEAPNEDVKVVMALAERCLRLTGEERPTMKEVEIILLGLRREETRKKYW